VWDAFNEAARADDTPAPDLRLVGQHGTTLRTLRNQAAYDRVVGLPARLQGVLETAQVALETLPPLKTK
jgi:hypothetical protein